MSELRGLIRLKIDAAGQAVDLYDILTAVKAEIDDFEAVFDDLAMPFIREAVRQMRHDTLRSDAQPEPAAIPIGRSKRSIGQAAWKAKLDVLVSIEGNGTMKRLGACSVVEVQALSEQYQRRAHELTSHAAWYDQIALAMRAAGVDAVADLPEATLQPLLSKVAA